MNKLIKKLIIWITPSPSHKPRVPPRSAKSFATSTFGNLDSVIVMVLSKLRKNIEKEFFQYLSVVIMPVIWKELVNLLKISF